MTVTRTKEQGDGWMSEENDISSQHFKQMKMDARNEPLNLMGYGDSPHNMEKKAKKMEEGIKRSRKAPYSPGTGLN